MEHLAQLAEALLLSLMVVGTAALHMLLLIWIIICVVIVFCFFWYGSQAAWYAGVAAYRRKTRGT